MREVAANDAMHPHDHAIPTARLGINVAQDTLNAYLLPVLGKPRPRSFPDDPVGPDGLPAWADEGRPDGAAPGFRMEGTGAYGAAGANAPAQAGKYVSL